MVRFRSAVLELRAGDAVRGTDGCHHERAIAEDSPIRKYVDVFAPTGSKQRELMKVMARKVQGKR